MRIWHAGGADGWALNAHICGSLWRCPPASLPCCQQHHSRLPAPPLERLFPGQVAACAHLLISTAHQDLCTTSTPPTGAGAAVPGRDCRRRQQGPDPQVQGGQDAAVGVQDGARVRAVQVRGAGAGAGAVLGVRRLMDMLHVHFGVIWCYDLLSIGSQLAPHFSISSLQAHAAHSHPQLLPGGRLYQAGAGRRACPAC